MALRVTMAYKIVSVPAVLVVSSLISVHLIVMKILEVHRRRKDGHVPVMVSGVGHR